MGNRRIAQKLLDYAHYLEAREANIFRVRAYRRVAETVLDLDRPLSDLLEAEGVGRDSRQRFSPFIRTGGIDAHL